jgi:hypothetical protein
VRHTQSIDLPMHVPEQSLKPITTNHLVSSAKLVLEPYAAANAGLKGETLRHINEMTCLGLCIL